MILCHFEGIYNSLNFNKQNLQPDGYWTFKQQRNRDWIMDMWVLGIRLPSSQHFCYPAVAHRDVWLVLAYAASESSESRAYHMSFHPGAQVIVSNHSLPRGSRVLYQSLRSPWTYGAAAVPNTWAECTEQLRFPVVCRLSLPQALITGVVGS